ncbi:hypothetical protein [Psychrobacter sp. I-STPA10]|uniref:hypothetical protein n=1 Tax=Psychrobacter sp. I-STPA10 TaxID=2585769 RepID=UPI001E6383F4|nr:hypothetical protein [Psychrobacter sp. I-STPA10]
MTDINAVQFPRANYITKEKSNVAIQVYGRRFLADQTPIEYLAEFLLLFHSKKSETKQNAEALKNNATDHSFCLSEETQYYFPKSRLPLKFFSFFSQSKLETRHPIHQKAFLDALDELGMHTQRGLSESEKHNLVQTLQTLLSGFVGVANNRTWCTYGFMPITPSFLGREVTWSHSSEEYASWEKSTDKFDVDRHNFMARGGEVLFLQIAFLFTEDSLIQSALAGICHNPSYQHLEFNLANLKQKLESSLQKLLQDETQQLEEVCEFIETTLSRYDISSEDSDIRSAKLASIPKSYVVEGFLFANEMLSLLNSKISKLEKIELLQQLCVLQVLRSIMARSVQIDINANTNSHKTTNYHANYSWIVCNPNATTKNDIRKLAEASFSKSEEIIYRVMRFVGKANGLKQSDYAKVDKHSCNVFRRQSKNIGLVIPQKGSGQRFVLTPSLIRLFVYTLIKNGTRIKLNDFLSRIYTHFGIAIEGQQLQEAIAWQLERDDDSVMNVDVSWVEEGLKQSGLLIELSDAISIVQNP